MEKIKEDLLAQTPQEKEKKFRIAAKAIFITYSKVPEQLISQEVLDELAKSVGYHYYIIAKEKHQDGGDHFHVLISNTRKYNIRNKNKLDIIFKDNIIHGNYQFANSMKAIAEFTAKDKEYGTNFDNFIDGRFLKPIEDLVRVAKNHASMILKGSSMHKVSKTMQKLATQYLHKHL